MTRGRRAAAALLGAACLWSGPAAAQEVLLEADASPREPAFRGRKVHGDVRLGAGFGFVAEDPIFMAEPSRGRDLRDVAPGQLRRGAPSRLRLYDREPHPGTVIRGTDWDEVGDYLTILQRLHYSGDYVFSREGRVLIDLRVGDLQRVSVGHGSLVRGYANSLDLDRRRTGIDLDARVEGLLAGHPAGAEIGVVAADLAGQQIFGTRIASDWAGAGLGFSIFGDPFAPRELVPWMGSAQALALDARNRPLTQGSVGAFALGLDLSYRWTDRWRFLVMPYLDLNLMPGVGKGLHLGVDTEFILGRRRRARLGAIAELTVGDRGYDPTYFDVFYTMQRMQAQMVARPDDLPADFAALAQPKYTFVLQNDLHGVGGYGGLRFSHEEGAFVETGYRYRPGPLGHTWETRLGVDLEVVQLSLLHAHRGALGFDVIDPAGTLARFDLTVPVLRYLEVFAQAGYQFQVRRAPGESAAARQPSGGFVGGGGLMMLGVAGRFGW